MQTDTEYRFTVTSQPNQPLDDEMLQLLADEGEAVNESRFTEANYSVPLNGSRAVKESFINCPHCKNPFDYAKQPEIAMGSVACPNCKRSVFQGQRDADPNNYTPLLPKTYPPYAAVNEGWLAANINVNHDEKGRFAESIYHVTLTKNVPKILKQGIKPFQTTNWVKAGSGERYGEGQIYSFSHPADAARWAAKTDWSFNKSMGSGKVSIIKAGRSEGWEKDPAQDESPLDSAGSKGDWLRRYKAVPPSEIIKVVPFTSDKVKAMTGGQKITDEKERAQALLDLVNEINYFTQLNNKAA